MKRLMGSCVMILCLVLSFASSQAEDNLASQFANPPAESRMASYWWIFGPAWTKPEIVRELGVLKKAGIGRVLIFPIYPYEVDNPVKGVHNQRYLSPEFLDTLRYALDAAHQKGMAVDLVMGTGWPYGGPEIPASLSPKRIYVETTPVAGTPGEEISLRLPAVPTGSTLISAQLIPADPSDGRAAVELTGQQTSGTTPVALPPGKWQVARFLEGPTRARHTVVFAAKGAGGNVIDHLSKKAVELYLKTVCDKLAVAGKGKIRAMYSPSFEVYGTNWTDGFLDEFQKRRGYDLRPHLDALFREQPDSADVRYDYWETVSDLANENYLETIGNWSHEHGFKFQSESYGEPPVTQASYSFTDLPMGEEYDWKEFNMVRWTSSAAHFFNHRIINDEAYTGLMDPGRYNETLQDLKRASDAVFVSGANRLVAHGYAYSPPSAGSPGWGYFAGAMLTENQPWWPYFHYLASYVHRTGFLLSQGTPVADVLVYLPEGDLYAEHAPGRMPLAWWVEGRLDRHKTQLPDYGIPKGVFDFKSDLVSTIISNGYSLDGIDHSVLAKEGTTRNAHFQVGAGSYSVIILPGVDGLPISDLQRIAEFCQRGGTLITTLHAPKHAYGLLSQKRDSRQFQALVGELFGGMDPSQPYQAKRVGQGQSILVKDETDTFAKALQAALPSDIKVAGGLTEIGFAHRHAADHDIYFLANFTDRPRDFEASFRAGSHTPEIWNPMNGKSAVARKFHYDRDRTSVEVHLQPYGSTFVIMTKGRQAPPRIQTQIPAKLEPPLPFRNSWNLHWNGLHTQPVEMARLESWTDFSAARYFSGRGTYTTTVDVPASYLQPRKRLMLHMGVVKNTAEVWINGRRAGAAWKLPHEVDVTGFLKPGKNRIRIDVTNLLINEVLNQPIKDYSAVEARNPGLRLRSPQEKLLFRQPLSSGLLGPVFITQNVP